MGLRNIRGGRYIREDEDLTEEEEEMVWGAVARAGVRAGMKAMRRELTEAEEEMWVGAALRVAGHVSNAITIGSAINNARKGRRREEVEDELEDLVLSSLESEEELGYSYGGTRYTNGGYKANPTRSAQIKARNAGALTNREARSMGLRNRREFEEEEELGWGSRHQNSFNVKWREDEEDLGYSVGGVRYNNNGYKANPTRSAQIAARNAGALTNREARSMGLRNRREFEDEEELGYSVGGVRYNNNGYKANPSRSA